MEPKSRTRRSRHAGDTRERLIDAAQALLIERDTLDITINEIGARADANPALIAYSFGSREGLLVEMLRRDAQEALTEVNRLLETPVPPLERIRQHIVGVIRVFYLKPYLNPLFHRLLAHGTSEASDVVMREFVLPLSAARTKMFEDAMADGTIRKIDPIMVEFAINGACEHFYASRAKTRALCRVEDLDKSLSERFAKSTVDLFLNGLLPRGD
jgi:TetR/AcrR family transcriptional regulator